MDFFAGAVLGGVAGFAVGLGLTRRGRATPATRMVFTTVVALLALVVGTVALVKSAGHSGSSKTAAPPSTTTAATTTSSTTTSTTERNTTVAVPDVHGLARDQAVGELQRAGLKVTVDTLSLANVPTGFVLSQTPLPDSIVPVGTTVSLVVSSAA